MDSDGHEYFYEVADRVARQAEFISMLRETLAFPARMPTAKAICMLIDYPCGRNLDPLLGLAEYDFHSSILFHCSSGVEKGYAISLSPGLGQITIKRGIQIT